MVAIGAKAASISFKPLAQLRSAGQSPTGEKAAKPELRQKVVLFRRFYQTLR
jgi:hypothetical protein